MALSLTGKMLKKLKKLLRDWILDDPDDYTLECIVKGGPVRRLTAVKAAGAYLLCIGRASVGDGAYQEIERLIGEADAVDLHRFCQLRRRLSSNRTAVWEDGTPVDLT